MKKILLTGGNGFLGRHLAPRLKAKGYEIVVPGIDLTRQRNVDYIFSTVRPDIVINLAAKVGGIEANRQRPAAFLYDNLTIGVEVMHQSAMYCVEKVIQLGSVCMYPKNAATPVKEENIWNGYPEETNGPYGIAKRVLLEQAQVYRKQYGLNAIYLIPANLYGPGADTNLLTSHVVPALVKKFVDSKKNGVDFVEVWGDGTATREFLYVDDCADGIIAALENYDSPDPVNLGNGRVVSIADLAFIIAGLTDFYGAVKFDTSKPSGQSSRMLDTSRAEAFGFKATTTLIEGLIRTIDWYKSL